MPSQIHVPAAPAGWIVACLCADWCDTCGSYRSSFDALARHNADIAFVWIDIEDDSDWLGETEVENFPTLLIAQQDRLLFFGPVLPQPEQAARLLASLRSAPTPVTPAGPDLQALSARLLDAVRSGSLAPVRPPR